MQKPCFAWISLVAMTALATGMASGQDYPNKPVRIITSGVGGSGDFISRLIAPGLSNLLGQPVIVENRPGFISDETVSKAPPDGYTLLVHGNAMWIAPLMQKVNYDPIRDFSPISLLQTYSSVLVVHPSLPVKSVKELIALAKAKPGQLNYGTSAIGGGAHLASELLKSMAGVNIVQINYKNVAATMTALISGEVQMAFTNLPEASTHIKSGRLRGLAIGNLQPSALFPSLPTVAASGLPGFEAGQFTGMFAPAKTPVSVINRLNREALQVLKQADLKEKFFNSGMEPLSSSPEEFAAMIKSDIATWGKVIKEAGIRIE